MNPGPGSIVEKEALSVSPDQQQSPSPHPTDLDHRIADILAAIKEQSDRLSLIERRCSGEVPGAEVTPETKELWESTVRRFTGSIDVRLDILEDELGSIQDELSRLQDVANENFGAAQRRLTWRYALGQALLGILIVVLFLAVGAGEGTDLATPWSSPEDSVAIPTASGNDSAAAAKSQAQAPTDDALVGVGADGDLTALPDAEPDETNMNASGSSALLEHKSTVDSLAKNNPAEPVAVQGQSAEGPEQESRGAGTSSPPQVLAADSQQFLKPEDPPTPLVTSEDAPSYSAEAEQQSTGSGETPATIQGQDGGNVPKDLSVSASDPTSHANPGAAGIILDNERFAIQLIGFNSESRVRPFAEKFGIVDTARYLHSRNQNRDWYLVMLTDYATQEQARAAIDDLPPELRKLEPWIRPLPAGTRLVPTSASGGAESGE